MDSDSRDAATEIVGTTKLPMIKLRVNHPSRLPGLAQVLDVEFLMSELRLFMAFPVI